MAERRVGINDIALFVPEQTISLETIRKNRVAHDPSLERRLKRAIESTGQKAVRFPRPWEDTVTLTAEAVRQLVRQGMDPKTLRFFATGTETSVDMSKPISAYAQGLLQRDGIDVPTSLSTFQVQHACAGGTASLMSVAAMLGAGRRENETGLVVCADVARYETPSTAEITQGAGAVAMEVSCDPDLLELDIDSVGFASRDEDDFFRPLGSITARVKGGYSVQCYNRALNEAFEDHAGRLGKPPQDVLNETDIFLLHVPFYKMAITAVHSLASHTCRCGHDEVRTFIEERGFEAGLYPTRYIGNIYSGSLYMGMKFSLAERFAKFGDDIVGKTVTLGSYGSGNTMIVLRGRVAEGAPARIAAWDLESLLKSATQATFDDYLRFVEPTTYNLSHGPISDEGVEPGRYYLSAIREDGFREYRVAE